ncbi:hypothetical protein AVEN_241962-1 [Araneus ventricosus]|uniref:Uncharacterized protein n=1 Tax=Araneus ventricosus TaxID=182803 RepID=A0A4Y2QBJ4_ARAVE|nr:hypothetical protein AVEN_241962-1 [Araneus ventricosus]
MATKNDGSCIGKDSSECRKSVKILILGEIGIGKTTLIETYLSTYDAAHEELGIFELYRVRMKYKDRMVDVGLIDLYPGPNCPERRESYPSDVNVILLCFSIGHYETLRCVYNLWIYEVRAHFGKNIPIFLVGLRSDVRLVKPPLPGKDRLVKKKEAETIHKNHSFHGDYMECSMNDRNSVVNVIHKAFFAALED